LEYKDDKSQQFTELETEIRSLRETLVDIERMIYAPLKLDNEEFNKIMNENERKLMRVAHEIWNFLEFYNLKLELSNIEDEK